MFIPIAVSYHNADAEEDPRRPAGEAFGELSDEMPTEPRRKKPIYDGSVKSHVWMKIKQDGK